MNRLPPPQEQSQQMIVTSCDDTDDCNDDDVSTAADSVNDDDDNDEMQQQQQKPDDLFFDEDADDEDEAYVYKHLRSGLMETINVVPRQHTSPALSNANRQCSTRTSSNHSNVQKLQVLKPRNTDAVLSCPYCFHIVCMDCQRHTTYKNQYRAMFVMNILVRWDMPLQYSNSNRCLEPYNMLRVTDPSIHNQNSNVISDIETDAVVASGDQSTATLRTKNDVNKTITCDIDMSNENTIYYTVCCANCQTTVAALDMTDEVYHFSGCLASA
jgi:E2F-associated phosphoprotein